MSARYPWSALGLEGPVDGKEVRRAYAVRLREIDRNDAAVFQQLVTARDNALKQARSQPARPSLRQIAETGAGEPRIKIATDHSSSSDRERFQTNIAKPQPTVKSKPVTQKTIVENVAEKTSKINTRRETQTNAPPPLPQQEQLWAKPDFSILENLQTRADKGDWKYIVDKLQNDQDPVTAQERKILEAHMYRQLIDASIFDRGRNSSWHALSPSDRHLYTILEEEFNWLSDSLAASRRLGVRKINPQLLSELRDIHRIKLGKPVLVKEKNRSAVSWWGYRLLAYFVIKLIFLIIQHSN